MLINKTTNKSLIIHHIKLKELSKQKGKKKKVKVMQRKCRDFRALISKETPQILFPKKQE